MLASELIKKIENNELNERLIDIYVDESMLESQKQRYINTINKYINRFGDDDVTIFSAPGRSEICGNHTDHQRGKVLACAVNLDIIAVCSKADNIVSVVSDDYKLNDVDINDLVKKPEESATSEALIRGCAYRLKELGYNIGGFKAYTDSTVVEGSGLSSSAAFETLIGTIFSGLYNDMSIDPVLIAQIGQYAENHFFDKPCGLMDQCASSVGSLIYIDFKDTTNPQVKKLDVNFSDYNHSLCIVDVHASHADLTPDYAAIPQEMKSVAKVLGKEVLVEVDEDEFYNNLASIREQVSDRALLRAIHLFEENKRVNNAVRALEQGEFEQFLDVVKTSGISSFNYLQNIYSNKDVDNQAVSLSLALSDINLTGNGVSRVHGGGFAGTTQAFVQDKYVDNYKQLIDNVFGEGSCHILKIRKYGGIQII